MAKLINAFVLSLFVATGFAAPAQTQPIPDPSVATLQCTSPQAFIKKFCDDYACNRSWVENVFDEAVPQPKIIASMQRPAEKLSWQRYRAIFLTTRRILLGQAFIAQNKNILQQEKTRYGVPPSIVASILGVETMYGTQQGGYRVLDALDTLAFCYPPREKYFQSELVQYLLLVQENHLNPFDIMGSYAGAFGMPQFMPHSYRSYAVNYGDDDGGANLVTNLNDSIMSIGNYLKKNGWQANQPVAVQVTTCPAGCAALANLNNRVHLDHTVANYVKVGAVLAHPVDSKLPANLVGLTDPSGNVIEYWLVFQNFKSIMSYNSSVDYAMAVYQLSQALQASPH